MIHAILTLSFLCLVTLYIRFEMPNHKLDWSKHTTWIVAAVLLPFVGSILSIVLGGKLGNFLLHAIGGGVATAFIFEYLRRLLGIRINWRLSLIGTFMLAAALGVLNELAEYAAELGHVGIFSFDTQDTWRDLLANSAGALIAWAFISLFARTSKGKD